MSPDSYVTYLPDRSHDRQHTKGTKLSATFSATASRSRPPSPSLDARGPRSAHSPWMPCRIRITPCLTALCSGTAPTGRWVHFDDLGLLQQLGALPSTEMGYGEAIT